MTSEFLPEAWTKRDQATHWSLFLLVLIAGMHFGAEVFDSIVNDPVWSASISTARAWESKDIDPGRFYAVFSMLLLLVSVLTLAVGWRARRPLRRWLATAVVLFSSAVAVTLGYFLPEIIQIRSAEAISIPDEELARRIRRWILLDTGRELMVFLGFVSTVHALGLSYRSRGQHEMTK